MKSLCEVIMKFYAVLLERDGPVKSVSERLFIMSVY